MMVSCPPYMADTVPKGIPTWALILGWALLLSGFAIFALLIAVFVKEEKPVYPMGYPMAYPMAYPPGYQQNPAQTR